MEGGFNLMKYKRLFIVIFIILIGGFILYLSNMRLTAVSALKANPFIGKEIRIIKQIDMDWGKVYIVDTLESIKTAVVEKHGLLWNSSVSFYAEKETLEQEQIKTIGYMSYTNSKQKQTQVLAMWNEDPKVSTIHITREDNEVFIQPTPLNELILFTWDEVFNINTTDILALNEEGKALYYYGYPKGTNILRDSEFKWHPIVE